MTRSTSSLFAVSTQAAADRQAVLARQHQVRHHDVGLPARQHPVHGRAAVRRVDRESLRGQELAHQIADVAIVLTHHRVHHASNEACLDRNFGGILIVYDRLFGSFAAAPADEPLRYGLKGDETPTDNPLKIVAAGWIAIARGVARARRLQDAGVALFGRP